MCLIKKVLYISSILSITTSIEASRILAVFPYPSKSHQVMFDAIVDALARRNHQVDVITHFPMNNPPPNYHVVVNLNGTVKSKANSITLEYLNNIHSGSLVTHVATNLGNKLCDLLGVNEMQAFIKNLPNDPPYDLVITHALASHCYMGFAHLLKVPLVTIVTTIEHPWFNEFIGNDDNLAYVTNFLMTNFDKHRFWSRLNNVLSYHWNVHVFHDCTDKYQTDMMRKYLSADTPNIRDVEKSVVLTLTNRSPLIHGVKPTIPSLVDVSGLHIKPNNSKLSPDLKKWLDESNGGVVYFTFGSMILIESLPENIILDLYKSFAKLAPMRVLMKIADKTKLPPGLPDNVLTLPWIPQQAVLAHKNIRAYLTHGGMFGSQEALYFGIPMIGIPLYGDQSLNVAAFAAKKMAIGLPFEKLSTKTLDEALHKILNDPSYRDNVRMYSKFFKDQPMTPIDTAMFWIEYIIRNKKFPFVPPALELQWWQLALLDVYGFILLTLVSSLAITYYVSKLLLKLVCSICHKKPKVD